MLVIQLMGVFRVYKDHQPVDISSRPAQTLLVYLLLNRGSKISRERIAGQLWPDVLESSARQSLRSALYILRRSIGEEYLVVDPSHLKFNPEAALQVDVDLIEAETDPSDLDGMIQAADLYQGDLLPGFDEEWVIVERQRLRALHELRMDALLNRLSEKAQWEDAILWAERWIGLGNFPEPAYRTLMKAHAARNDLSGVTSAYQRCVQVLQSQLGIEPSIETLELYRHLLEGRPGVLVSTPGETETGKASSQPAGKKAVNLPGYGTSFIGREKEVGEIQQLLLEEPECRLLSLTGPGGIGKTRLAVQAARDLPFEGGVWFLSLVSIQSPAALLNRMIELFGIPCQEGGQPRENLFRFLSSRKLLLVLDNFEHLLSGSGDSLEEDAVGLVAGILEQAKGVKILLTSRERLNISMEWILPLDGLQTDKAVRLFLQRTRQVNRKIRIDAQGTQAVHRICAMVGGLPLAVEMAAAWSGVLSIDQIEKEIQQGLEILSTSLRDFPIRHQKMRVVFDTSWIRLSEEEQELFRQLSVFRGDFSRQAVDQVCLLDGGPSSGDPGLQERESSSEMLSLLSGLVEKSLLQTVPPDHYRIHELLRQYGEERLVASGQQTAARDRHARFYLSLLTSMETSLKGSEQHLALDRIAPQVDNIISAWYWAAGCGSLDLLIQSMEVIWLFFVMRRYSLELLSIMQHTLSLVDRLPTAGLANEDIKREIVRGMVTAVSGGSLMIAGQFSEADELMERAARLLSACDARRWLALVRNWQASNHLSRGDLDQAQQCIRQSIQLSEQVGDQWLRAYALNDLGLITHLLGDTAEAKRISLESLQIFQAIDDRRGKAFVYSNLGLYASHIQAEEDALHCYEESHRLRELNHDHWGMADALIRVGAISRSLGNAEDSELNLVKAISIAHEKQFLPVLLDAMIEFALLFEQRGKLQDAERILSVCLAQSSLSRETHQKALQLQGRLHGSNWAVLRNPPSASSLEQEVSRLLEQFPVST